MSWLWQQWQDFALACAIIFGAYLAICLMRWAYTDPRGFAAKLCGELALLFGLLALLWGAHISG